MDERGKLDEFLDFCKKALGESDAPLKGQPAAMATALANAFIEITKPPVELRPGSEVQRFEDAVYSEPWCVYVIRNQVNGRAYVGMATGGFLKRYPKGEWWLDHQNERLRDDALVYGLTAFRVHVYIGADELDMKRLEAQLISTHRLFTYNLKPEPTNRRKGRRT